MNIAISLDIYTILIGFIILVILFKMWNPFEIDKIKASFRRLNKTLFVTLLARLLIPSIYITVRVYILGNVKQDDTIKIIAQMQWVNCILEILEEGLLQPLYHCFGESVSEDNSTLQAKVRSGFFVCIIFYAFFCTITGICAPQLVDLMAQQDKITDETITYLRIELCGIFIKGLAKLFAIVLVLKKQSLYLVVLLFVQLFCSIALDLFFFS